jgi:AcrR family transcriptional regulator
MSTKRAGRRPDPSVDPAIRKATLELMMERGFDLTFDDVAARAGVGRTTVFRRYATKHDLIAAAARGAIDRMDFPDTGSLRGDLAAAVATVFDHFGREPLRLVAPHLLAAAGQGQPGGEILHGVLGRRLELVTALLDRAAARGEIRDAGRAPVVADLLTGIIVTRMATRAPLPHGEEIDDLVPALVVAAGGHTE